MKKVKKGFKRKKIKKINLSIKSKVKKEMCETLWGTENEKLTMESAQKDCLIACKVCKTNKKD